MPDVPPEKKERPEKNDLRRPEGFHRAEVVDKDFTDITQRSRDHNHEQRLEPAEQRERASVARPNDGVAFRYGSSRLDPGEFQRWYQQLDLELKRALQRPNTEVTIIGKASRPGSEGLNQLLSEQRANVTRLALEQTPGFKAKISVVAAGERDATEAGKPEEKDDAGDRVATISVKHGSERNEKGDVNQALSSVRGSPELRHPEDDQNFQKQAEIGKEAIATLVKEFGTNLLKGRHPLEALAEAALDASKDFLKGEGGFVRDNFIADRKDIPALKKIGASVGIGLLHGLEEATGVDKSAVRSNPALLSGKYYGLAKEMGRDIWDTMPEWEQKNLAAVMKNPEERREFAQKLVETYLGEILSRRKVQSPR